MSFSKKRRSEESDLEEIRKGFELFDTNGTGKIIPSEIKEAMESMNIQEKNPFIYEIISSLSSADNIENKEGISIDDLVNYVYEKVNDNESNLGLKQLFDALKDPNTNKISMHTFMALAKDYDEDDFSGNELNYLLEKTQLGGDELTYEEFCTIMKGGISSISIKSDDNNYDNYDMKKKPPLSDILSQEMDESKKNDDNNNINEIEIKENKEDINNNNIEIKEDNDNNNNMDDNNENKNEIILENEDNNLNENNINLKSEIIIENKKEDEKPKEDNNNIISKVEEVHEVKEIEEKPIIMEQKMGQE